MNILSCSFNFSQWSFVILEFFKHIKRFAPFFLLFWQLSWTSANLPDGEENVQICYQYEVSCPSPPSQSAPSNNPFCCFLLCYYSNKVIALVFCCLMLLVVIGFTSSFLRSVSVFLGCWQTKEISKHRIPNSVWTEMWRACSPKTACRHRIDGAREAEAWTRRSIFGKKSAPDLRE